MFGSNKQGCEWPCSPETLKMPYSSRGWLSVFSMAQLGVMPEVGDLTPYDACDKW